MDPAKVSCIVDWPVPKSVHDIQVFLGFSNFYRRFIHEYSKLTVPLTKLLKKNVSFDWSDAAAAAFNALKVHSRLLLYYSILIRLCLLLLKLMLRTLL